MKGFKPASKFFRDEARRIARPKQALQAIGKEVVNRHIRYFKSGSQGAKGGGPPGDPWPALAASTTHQKGKRGKTRKLIDTGLLRTGFEYRVSGNTVEIFNRENSKVDYLQVKGVGKKRKKFTIVAANLEKHDPKLLKDTEEITANFIFSGKPTK